ncbi:MAG: hypothetical protein K0S33_3737 [Bacteroidetes bacterium]|jgi:hypothetical protein|nr:hypothetical protein [Bacteroidota bacterium]
MKKFEFEITLSAPSEKDAIQKMNCLNALGSKLSLAELQALANTVNSPTALALAKQKLGL